MKSRFAFTLEDLILLQSAAKTLYKHTPKTMEHRKELARAIRRADSVIKGGRL